VEGWDVMNGKRWYLRALSIFLILMVLWIAAAFVLNSAAAGTISLPLNLQTRLQADYGDDPGMGPLGVFRLAIVGEAMRDQGIPTEEVEAQSSHFKESMDDPVPTATARNFEGDDPFTATPTHTNTPTKTFTPTVTNTPTPRPTNTPESTETPKPRTNKPTKQPKPTEPGPSVDTSNPSILGGWVLDPEPGEVGSCTIEVTVSDLHIYDESYSSGIDWIKLKYRHPLTDNYVYSAPLNPDPPAGWEMGDSWDDVYTISMDITINPVCTTSVDPSSGGWLLVSFDARAANIVEEYEVPLYAYIKDNAGRTTYRELGEYEFPASCCE
jgi:hypothetical protein